MKHFSKERKENREKIEEKLTTTHTDMSNLYNLENKTKDNTMAVQNESSDSEKT